MLGLTLFSKVAQSIKLPRVNSSIGNDELKFFATQNLINKL